jgi:hypothetical protein
MYHEGVALMSPLYKPEHDGVALRRFSDILCYRHGPGGA